MVNATAHAHQITVRNATEQEKGLHQTGLNMIVVTVRAPALTVRARIVTKTVQSAKDLATKSVGDATELDANRTVRA